MFLESLSIAKICSKPIDLGDFDLATAALTTVFSICSGVAPGYHTMGLAIRELGVGPGSESDGNFHELGVENGQLNLGAIT